MHEFPVASEEDRMAERGVRMVWAAIEDDLGWIFRPKRKTDVGIDGEIEIARDNREATGILMSVQIKCGSSFFKEENQDGYVFRGELKHLNYWLNHSLPVLIILCDVKKGNCYWTDVTTANATRLKKGWKVTVPFANTLAPENKWKLQRLAQRNDIDLIIDLSLTKWLHEKYPKRVVVCTIFDLPRDWLYYHGLIDLDGVPVAIHYIYDRYGQFEPDQIRYALESWPKFVGQYDVRRLLLCLVSQSPSSFRYSEEAASLLSSVGPDVEVVRFLLYQGQLMEVGPDDEIIDCYSHPGEPMPFAGNLFDFKPF